MALYAFDGTWNEDEAEAAKETNVLKFCKCLPLDMNVFYLEGVGTRLGFIGKLLGGAAGVGGRFRINRAMEQLRQYFEEGDRTVDIIGFSRGAALALHFANQVQEEQPEAEIRFLGLWDVVASFGLPGNDLNIGWDLTLPDNVKHCYHAMALDERRGNFCLTRVEPRKGGRIGNRLQEVWFRGVHSDVGGGQCHGLSNITLSWMLRRAKDLGLPVDEAKLQAHEALCDANAGVSKNFDPKKDPQRRINPGDFVHESVKARGSSGGRVHNDPPAGVRIVKEKKDDMNSLPVASLPAGVPPASRSSVGLGSTATGAEPVDTAVFCPPRVACDSVFLLQVFLYTPCAATEVDKQARQVDEAAERRGTYSLPLDLPRDTKVYLHIEIPTLTISEPDALLVWRGATTAAQFEVVVPPGTAGSQVIGRVRIAVAGVPAGTLRFKLTLTAAGTPVGAADAREVRARRYRHAFVSYSSQDRAEVLRRVQAFRIAGLSVFQDILDLDPGERWQKALYHQIDNCDVFLLFWSHAAAASEWVGKEIDYALARKQGDEERLPDIQPVPIEGPPIAPPPATLKSLHFNDALLAQIRTAEATILLQRAGAGL